MHRQHLKIQTTQYTQIAKSPLLGQDFPKFLQLCISTLGGPGCPCTGGQGQPSHYLHDVLILKIDPQAAAFFENLHI